MDRNTVIGLVLIFLILVGYSFWTAPSKEEKARAAQVLDSLEQVRHVADSLKAIELAATIKADTIQIIGQGEVEVPAIVLSDKFGPFAPATVGDEKYFSIENDLYKITVASKGGRIASVLLKNFVTWDSLPLLLFNEASSRFEFSFFADNRSINTKELFFVPVTSMPESGLKVSGDDTMQLIVRAYAQSLTSSPGSEMDSLGPGSRQSERYIEFIYTLAGNDYMMDFDIRFVGLKEALASNVDLLLDWSANTKQFEKSHDNEKNLTTIYYQDNLNDVGSLSERKDDQEELSTGARWVGFKQQFFTSTLIGEELFSGVKLRTESRDDMKDSSYLKTLAAEISIPYTNSEVSEQNLKFYFGPIKYRILRSYKLKLERQIPLGWGFAPLAWINLIAVIPVFNFLEGYNLNYGIIILILTLLLKLLLFPIAYKTYVSSAKMKVLRPEVEEIGKKFTKKEDALKKQQATMELYRRAGASPMAGCVPMLLQFPILIAMFRFFPASIELRQEKFLWATDLSSYDSVLDLGFSIPFYGDHVSLFTLLMTISTIIYTYMNNQMMSSTQQIPGMKTMMYLMPIMFLGFFNSYASGLSYYYLLANIITFGQMWIFRQTIDEDALHRKIQENKKKPIRKSKFQQRLEEAAKSRGYNSKR